MAEHSILDAVLDNTQIPHQPLVIIVDSAVFSGLPVFRESLRRALNRGGPVLVVSSLYDAEALGVHGATIISPGIPGFTDDESADDLEKRILEACCSGTQIYIDALDIISDDHSSAFAIRMIRAILRLIKSSKAPSRLNLLLPHTSPLLPSLHSPTLSPALTLLYPHHPQVLSHLSRSYLLPIDASPQFWTILDRARSRHLPEKLAYGALDGVEVTGDWSISQSSTSATNGGSSNGAASAGTAGAIVGILVRKPTGGVKGISRAFAAISPSSGTISGNARSTLSTGPIDMLVNPNPINAPGSASHAITKPATTHIDLDLPFNLTLTDEQKRRRGEVPVPYAHEGEGVGIEFEEEDDDDDED